MSSLWYLIKKDVVKCAFDHYVLIPVYEGIVQDSLFTAEGRSQHIFKHIIILMRNKPEIKSTDHLYRSSYCHINIRLKEYFLRSKYFLSKNMNSTSEIN